MSKFPSASPFEIGLLQISLRAELFSFLKKNFIECKKNKRNLKIGSLVKQCIVYNETELNQIILLDLDGMRNINLLSDQYNLNTINIF
jgi:hypothetical protein